MYFKFTDVTSTRLTGSEMNCIDEKCKIGETNIVYLLTYFFCFHFSLSILICLQVFSEESTLILICFIISIVFSIFQNTFGCMVCFISRLQSEIKLLSRKHWETFGRGLEAFFCNVSIFFSSLISDFL